MKETTKVPVARIAPAGCRAEGLRDFAASLGISFDTAYRAAKDGRLKTIRFGKRMLVPAAEADRVAREGL